MKRILILLIGCLTIGHITSKGQNFSVGIKAGLNIANQSISGNGFSGSVSNLYGFHGGLFAVVKFNDHIGLQPEVQYSMQGWSVSLFGSDISLKLDYVNIPVLFRYNATSIFHLDAGPQIGILTSAKVTAMGSSADVKAAYHDVDWSMAFGAGIDLPIKLTFGFRYILGISDVDKDDTITSKNTNVQFSVGYKF